MTPDDLRARRAALHLTQKQLAEVLGVSKSTVSHWEQGVQKTPDYLNFAFRTLERQAMTDDTTEPDLQRIVEEMMPDE
jgi:transcriptional regulator with XRE-family HTH domain